MAAANINDVDLVLIICGKDNPVTLGNIIARQGFETLEGLGIMEDDKDIIEMAKRMAFRSQNQRHINLSTVTNESLQALVWWMHDHQKLNLPLYTATFNRAVWPPLLRGR